MNTQATEVKMTPAQKRKATREAKKAKLEAAVNHRNDLFEAMSEDDMNTMCARIEEIKDDYREQMESFEEGLLEEMDQKLAGVVEDYSWDVVKSYVESDFNGSSTFYGSFDLDHTVDEWESESTFESGVQLPTQADADFIADLAKRTSPTQADMVKKLALAKKGDITEDGKHVVFLDEQPEDGFRIVREITPGETCGICGRPWINGKCEGGFINHKL